MTASAGAGASVTDQLYHLILPAIPLVLILFGYIARMARAGTIEALESDYARTATLKGLPRWTVIRRHVLRNSLLPTITVIATQTGYLIGGLVIVEILFNYQGIGQPDLPGGEREGLPDAGSRDPDHRGGVHGGHALRGPAVHGAQPAAADRGRRMTDVAAPPPAAAVAVAHTRRSASAAPWRLLLRRPTFLVGMSILLFWVVCAVFGTVIAPYSPLRPAAAGGEPRPVRRALVRHRPDRP